MTTATHAGQRAMRQGTRRAVDQRTRPDHGANGPAMKCRASAVVETAEAGVTVRWMEEDSPIAHYRRGALLKDRQCDALARLAEWYEESGRRAATTASYGTRVGGFAEMSDAQAHAWREYCKLLDVAPAQCRHAVASVASGDFPGFSGALNLLRIGATALADHLRYDY